MQTDKKIMLEMECGKSFTVDAHEVIDDRSKYYAENDSDTTYDEEYKWVAESDGAEAIDWLQNNMNWYKCKTMKEVASDIPPDFSEMEIEDLHIFTPEKNA